MSFIGEDLTAHLKHHKMGNSDSQLIDKAIGLTWRQQKADELLTAAIGTEAYGSTLTTRILLDAAILMEDAIKHDINLKDEGS